MSLTACRWLIERWLEPGSVSRDVLVPEEARDESLWIAIVVCRMVSECEHESIYAGPPGAFLLMQAAGGAGAPSEVVAIARSFSQLLWSRARTSSADATRCFAIQLAAVLRAAQTWGNEASSRLT